MLIARALSAAGGNVAEAARRLSTDRANLYRRMKRLGIEPSGVTCRNDTACSTPRDRRRGSARSCETAKLQRFI